MKLRLFLLLIIPFFTACFDYEEAIYFKNGFSGYVEITYTVPLNNRYERSVIKFLPIQEEEINNRINKGLFSRNIKIKDYSMKIIDRTEKDPSIFLKKARVNYKIEFNELTSLDGVLIGYLFIKKKTNKTISIRREFKSVLKAIDQDSTQGEKRIVSETLRLLGESAIIFKVYYPTSSEGRSSKGEVGLGSIFYKLPLVDTIEKPGVKTWDYTITNLY